MKLVYKGTVTKLLLYYLYYTVHYY